MSVIKAVKKEIKKNLHLPFFVVGILGILLLLMFGIIYTDETGRQHMFIEFLFKDKKTEIIRNHAIFAVNVVLLADNKWFYEFLPAFVIIGYMFVLSSEREKGGFRFLIMRESIHTYCVSKMLALMLTGGVIVLSAAALYIAIVFFTISSTPEPFVLQAFLGSFGVGSVKAMIIKWLLSMFLLGCFSVIPGCLAGIFFNDRYMMICLPVLIQYVYDQLLQKLEFNMLEKENTSGYRNLRKIRLSNLLRAEDRKSLIFTVLFGFMLLVFCFLAFYFVVKEQRKRGKYV